MKYSLESCKKELRVTPISRDEAVEKWHELKPEIFKEKPLQFKNKILSLHHHIKSKQGYFIQHPCEA